jgi:hypothetical protein
MGTVSPSTTDGGGELINEFEAYLENNRRQRRRLTGREDLDYRNERHDGKN